MTKYRKLILLALFAIFFGTAIYILKSLVLNPYIVRNAVIDQKKQYIAGVASKYHWKDYKVFVYDLEKNKLLTKTLTFERDWNSLSYTLIGHGVTPAFSEDSTSVFWLHPNKKYDSTYKLINWNFATDALTEELKPDRRIFRFEIISPTKHFVWYDYNETVHIDTFGPIRGESFKPFEEDLQGMRVSPDGQLIATWGDDWPWDKKGEQQAIKIWRINNETAKAEHTIHLEGILADTTLVRAQFSPDSKSMYLFIKQQLDSLRRYEDMRQICRSYEFNTKTWEQVNQYNYECKWTSLQSSIVRDDAKRLLEVEYNKYPNAALREIAFKDNGPLIKEYHSFEYVVRRDISVPAYFYGKNNAIHAVTGRNQLYSFKSNDSTPAIKRLNLNRDVPYWAILFIFFAFGMLTLFIIDAQKNLYIYKPNIFSGLLIIYTISFSIAWFALQFAAIQKRFLWLNLWPIGGFVLIMSFIFRRHLKFKVLSWVIAIGLLLIPTALFCIGASAG